MCISLAKRLLSLDPQDLGPAGHEQGQGHEGPCQEKKTLAEDSLLPLHTVAVPLTVGQSPGPTTLLTLVVSNIPL